MSVYRINADYSQDGPITNEQPRHPCRLQVATSEAFGQLLLSRADYDLVLDVVATAAEEEEPSERTITNGCFAIEPSPPGAEDPWEVEMQQEGLQFKFVLSEQELESFENMLRAVHPRHEADEDDPNMEVHS